MSNKISDIIYSIPVYSKLGFYFNIKYNYENEKLNITIPEFRTFLDIKDNCLSEEFKLQLRSFKCSEKDIFIIEHKLLNQLKKLHIINTYSKSNIKLDNFH